MSEDWTVDFKDQLSQMREAITCMHARIAETTPAEACTIYRQLFEQQASQFDKAANAAAGMAADLRGLADAMRAKMRGLQA